MEAGVQALLTQGRNFCHLVSRRSDGSPRVVVIWVDAADGHVLLNGQEGDRHWLEDVRRDPRVICTVVNMEDPYEYVTIHGRVVEDTHEGPRAWQALICVVFGYYLASTPLGQYIDAACTAIARLISGIQF